MTSQTSRYRRAVTGAVASSALAVGLMVGLGAPAALADDTETTPPADASPTPRPVAPQTADEVLAIIEADYNLGAGNGQLAKLIDTVLGLRAQGFYPSDANREEIVEALAYRPNQTPLIEALSNTVAYQRKMQARSQVPSNPFVTGINQPPPGQQPDPSNPDNTGVFMAPGGIPIPLPPGP